MVFTALSNFFSILPKNITFPLITKLHTSNLFCCISKDVLSFPLPSFDDEFEQYSGIKFLDGDFDEGDAVDILKFLNFTEKIESIQRWHIRVEPVEGDLVYYSFESKWGDMLCIGNGAYSEFLK